MRWSRWFAVGAILAALSVGLGAFAAHGLTGLFAEKYAGQTRLVAGETIPLAAKYLGDFKTAAAYQMYHALAIIAVALVMRDHGGGEHRVGEHRAGSLSSRMFSLANWSFLFGILLFSGSLYVLTLTGISKLGAITPLGGLAFLIGWLLTALAALNHREQAAPAA